ncbi:MAG: methyltransferase domain-containing protein [Chloroflexi bacterium]|nr:methyltransferase domain-containing protein [Chloroflexota bacterium]
MPTQNYNAANVERFAGFADRYDRFRPQPPRDLIALLKQLAETKQPHRVVDLGSGTGLSTLIWANDADEIIGIEPSVDMRAQAEARLAATNFQNIHFTEGSSTQTNLPDESTDIVTCSQSLHWMEPAPTFAEIARILRAGGVFAAYDCDWPPTLNAEAEAAYIEFETRAEEVGAARGFYRDVKRWDKEGHLARMRASEKFRFVKEIVMHNVEQGNAERLIGVALSQGSVATLLKRGMSEAEIGVPEFRARVERVLNAKTLPWYFSYRVRLGIK